MLHLLTNVYFTKRSCSVKNIILFTLFVSAFVQAKTIKKKIITRSPKKIVVIGGASAIGQALTKELIKKGHQVVAADDDRDILNYMQEEQGAQLITRYFPLMQAEESRQVFKALIEELGGLDICILCCAIAPEIEQYGLLHDGDIPWGPSKDTITVNVMGITALANVAMNYFIDQQKGYLVGVSSLDALVGHPGCPCYTASKAFMSNYLTAMRKKCSRLQLDNIVICDIRWSFVDEIRDELVVGWIDNPSDAAVDILQAIEQKKTVAYIMDKWSFALWTLMALPSLIQNALSGLSMLKMAHM